MAEAEVSYLLNNNQLKVIELMYETKMTREEIANKVGVGTRTISRWKNENEEFQEAMNNYAHKSIVNAVPKALGTMIGLLNARSELVRFNAAKDLLDRGGFAPTDKVDLSGNDINIKIGGTDDG